MNYLIEVDSDSGMILFAELSPHASEEKMQNEMEGALWGLCC